MLALALALAGVFAAIVLVAVVVSSSLAERSAMRESLRAIDEYGVESSRDVELRRNLSARVGAPVVQGVVGLGRRLTPAGYIQQSSEKLVKAGKATVDDLDQFLAIRVVTFALIPVAFFVSFFALPVSARMSLVLFAFITMLLVLGPDAKLNREVQDRAYAIQIRLPDVLDLLVISVEAGLGFEQALDRTVNAVPGPLSEEFARMVGEVRAGASRGDAMRALEQRVGVPEVKSFVLAILQADSFGVSIGRVLRSQADEMRVRRRQLAQEKAQKAPVKMLFPMVFCVFPALFVVVLGPAAMDVIENLRNV